MPKWPFKVRTHHSPKSNTFISLKEHVIGVHGWIKWPRTYETMEKDHQKSHEQFQWDHTHDL